MKENYVIGVCVLVGALFLGGLFFLTGDSPSLRGYGGQDTYVMSTDYATSSISICISSNYHLTPTSTDPSVPTAGTHNPWVCSTTTWSGTPDTIPNSMDNAGFEYCVDATGHAVRFWFENTTGTDKKMSVGENSNGFLLTAGNCWKSNDYDIVWGGTVYAIASTTTSTLRYHIFKGQ